MSRADIKTLWLPAALILVILIVFVTVRLMVNGQKNNPASVTPTNGPASTTTLPELPTQDPTNDLQSTDTPDLAINSTPDICGQTWGIDPPEDLPAWLSTPAAADDLNTNVDYVYLAGELIKHGFVVASACPNDGLTADGVANSCGLEVASYKVVEWQNQFDQDILNAALQDQVPAQLMKRLFAQETQFWPNTTFSPPAYGIGNATSPGIDPLFQWNGSVYQQTCQDLFSSPCSQAYGDLALADQQRVRGFFISHYLHAYCPTCDHGIDVQKVHTSIGYFSKLLVANCQQVNLLLKAYDYSQDNLSFQDAWRLTLANYTVGSGCVEKGLEDMDHSKVFSWDTFTKIVDPTCLVSIIVSNITR